LFALYAGDVENVLSKLTKITLITGGQTGGLAWEFTVTKLILGEVAETASLSEPIEIYDLDRSEYPGLGIINLYSIAGVEKAMSGFAFPAPASGTSLWRWKLSHW
jgi:hypothetical protein